MFEAWVLDAIAISGQVGLRLELDEIVLDTHGMDPLRVVALARAMGRIPERILVVACEPEIVVHGEHSPSHVDGARAHDGEREARWMHCLSGTPAEDSVSSAEVLGPGDLSISEIVALKAHVGRLEDEVAQLRARFDKLARELGASG